MCGVARGGEVVVWRWWGRSTEPTQPVAQELSVQMPEFKHRNVFAKRETANQPRPSVDTGRLPARAMPVHRGTGEPTNCASRVYPCTAPAVRRGWNALPSGTRSPAIIGGMPAIRQQHANWGTSRQHSPYWPPPHPGTGSGGGDNTFVNTRTTPSRWLGLRYHWAGRFNRTNWCTGCRRIAPPETRGTRVGICLRPDTTVINSGNRARKGSATKPGRACRDLVCQVDTPLQFQRFSYP